jgi:hypothetical protein
MASSPEKNKKDCFIIAPISTPKEVQELYRGDGDHFIHVLKQLVVPAVIKAGFNPIEPIMEGSDVIHAKIIRNLEQAPLVLCDISSLNPNVMVELGVRTALNKPVCIIKDDVTPTERVPFDLSIINHHTYHSDPTWTLVAEIEKLAAHVGHSSGDQDNALWKYFGLKLTAHVPEAKGTAEDRKSDLLFAEIAALRKEVKSLGTPTPPTGPAGYLGPSVPKYGWASGYSGVSMVPPPGGYGTGLVSPSMDYLGMVSVGISPAILWWTTTGTSVGDVMKQIYDKAIESGITLHHMYFDAGVITITVEPKQVNHPSRILLDSIALSHGLQVVVQSL